MPKPNYSPELKRKVVEEHLKGGKSGARQANAIRLPDHLNHAAP